MPYETNLGRVVGTMIYSGTAATSEAIIQDLHNRQVNILDGDMYFSIGTEIVIWQYSEAEELFAKLASIWDDSRVEVLIKNLTSKYQSTLSLIKNTTENINGKQLSDFSVQEITIEEQTVLQVLKNNEICSKDDASEYLEYMTGSKFVPEYDENHPRNSYFMSPSGEVLKPQWDETNGLLLFNANNLTTKNYVDNAVTQLLTALNNHKDNKNNPHEVTKQQVGLGNVDNTSDADKPISTAQQQALDQKVNTAYLFQNGKVKKELIPDDFDEVMEFEKEVNGADFIADTLETEIGSVVWCSATKAIAGDTYYRKFIVNNDGTEAGLTTIDPAKGKLYVGKARNNLYGWSGSNLIEISKSLALGETSTTAYAGNKGKANADAIAAMQPKVDAHEYVLTGFDYGSSTNTHSLETNEFYLWGDNNTCLKIGWNDWDLDIYMDRIVTHYDGLTTTFLLPRHESGEDATETLATREWVKDNVKNMISITYSELKALRDSGQLIPGMKYRIIDYQTTTAQEYTRSAGHQFDIIVEADSETQLNENAKAYLHDGDSSYFGKTIQFIESANWKPNVTIQDAQVFFTLQNGEEIYGNTHESSQVVTQMTTHVNKDGVVVPALLNPDPDEIGNDCLYVYDGVFTISKMVNQLVSVMYTLDDGDEVIYDTDEYHPEDIFVELGYDNGTPVLYKNDISEYSEEGTDYEDIFEYIGDMVLDGVTYNKWNKRNINDGDSGYIVLTQVVVVNNQFTITQQQLEAAIQEVSTTYDKWIEFYTGEGDIEAGFKPVYHLTNQLVDAVLVPKVVERVDLSSWELRYCLDNDEDRFGWADSVNGKGVIFYMKDDFGNELSYDFKNIQFKRWFNNGKYDITDINNASDPEDFIWCFTFSCQYVDTPQEDATLDKKWGIEYNKVEKFRRDYNPCRLNNIVFLMEMGGYIRDNVFEMNCFDMTIGSNCASNHLKENCYNNSIGYAFCDNMIETAFSGNVIGNDFQVNKISEGFQSNIIGNGFYDNTISNSFVNNTIGSYFSHNVIGNNCRNSTFGSNCTKNHIGQDYNHNTHGDDFYDNTLRDRNHDLIFGSGIGGNRFTDDNHDITFADRVYNNVFDCGCHHIELKTWCSNNTFNNDCNNIGWTNNSGSNCHHNVFGKECHDINFDTFNWYNTFGDNCHHIDLGNSANYNTFENACYTITIGESSLHNLFKWNCNNITLGRNCENNTFDHICHNMTLGRDCIFNIFGSNNYIIDFGEYCQYNTFGHGCHDIEFQNRCTHNQLGNNCSDYTWGSYCVSNKVGNSCTEINFGDDCGYNEIDGYCSMIYLSDQCNHNKFLLGCNDIHFGELCGGNILYSGTDVTFSEGCCGNVLENNFNGISLDDYCCHNTIGKDAMGIHLSERYTRFVTISDGCSYIEVLTTSSSGGSSNNYLQNITIHKGVKGTSSNPMNIAVPRNIQYEYNVVSSNDVTVTV